MWGAPRPVEWFRPPWEAVTVVPRGTTVGGHEVTAEVGLVLINDEVCVIESTWHELRDLARGIVSSSRRSATAGAEATLRAQLPR